ncbi:unnamed protein product, partial [Timema podura]|nr:unnamed protein product [Timema podura]
MSKVEFSKSAPAFLCVGVGHLLNVELVTSGLEFGIRIAAGFIAGREVWRRQGPLSTSVPATSERVRQTLCIDRYTLRVLHQKSGEIIITGLERLNLTAFAWRKSGKPFRPISVHQDLHLDRSIIISPVYGESDALGHAATKAGKNSNYSNAFRQSNSSDSIYFPILTYRLQRLVVECVTNVREQGALDIFLCGPVQIAILRESVWNHESLGWREESHSFQTR